MPNKSHLFQVFFVVGIVLLTFGVSSFPLARVLGMWVQKNQTEPYVQNQLSLLKKSLEMMLPESSSSI